MRISEYFSSICGHRSWPGNFLNKKSHVNCRVMSRASACACAQIAQVGD